MTFDAKDQFLKQLETLSKDNAPEFIYFLTLFHTFQDFLEDIDEENIIKTKTGFKDTVVWNKLYKFQRDGVLGAIDKLERYNGCIIADSVGLGKTFEALAVIKYYELRNDRVLVLCPKKLRENWSIYTINDKRNLLAKDRFNYDVLNHTDLTRLTGKSGEINLETLNWGNYDLVVIDESHNFRNVTKSDKGLTRYSRLMDELIRSGVKTKVLMLSATPVNNRIEMPFSYRNIVVKIPSSKRERPVTTIQSVPMRKIYQIESILFIYPSLILMAGCIIIVQLFSFPYQVKAEPQMAQQHIQLTIAGSGANLPITRLLAKSFAKLHPSITIEIPGSIGSKGAIMAVSKGAINLGLISRPLTDEEKALGLVAQPYARTAIVIGVHPSVKDDDITTEQLIEIFKSIKTKWQDGNHIIVQAREKSDSGFRVLENTLSGFKEVYAESHEAKRWTLYFNDQAANEALAAVPYAIGVTDLGMITTEQLPIKALRLNGVYPNLEKLKDDSYPLSRNLWFIYRAAGMRDEALAFVAFVASSAGRDILLENGYLPVQ